MKREMEFRGKQEDWEYGGFYTHNGYSYIFNQFGSFEVDIKSVGEYTGLKDKKGKKIFEGDITNYGIVKWYDNLNWDSGGSIHPGFYLTGFGFDDGDGDLQYDVGFFSDIEVIGNIYDNPELINKNK